MGPVLLRTGEVPEGSEPLPRDIELALKDLEPLPRDLEPAFRDLELFPQGS